jgi:hypothetical protein
MFARCLTQRLRFVMGERQQRRDVLVTAVRTLFDLDNGLPRSVHTLQADPLVVRRVAGPIVKVHFGDWCRRDSAPAKAKPPGRWAGWPSSRIGIGSNDGSREQF